MKARRVAWGLSLVFGLTSGCASPLERAREAWNEGKGDYDEAHALYKEALTKPQLAPTAREEMFELYVEQARIEAKDGKYKAAEELYRQALEIDPNDVTALDGRARMLRELFRYDEALEVAEEGMAKGCTACERLRAALLVQRGDQLAEAGRWPEAETDYLEAMKVVPDASIALSIVRCRYARRNLDGAVDALRQARELIGPHDTQAQSYYLDLRRVVVLLALEKNRVPLADQLLDLLPPGVAVESQVDLALEVATEFNRAGKPDMGLARLTVLVDAAAKGELPLTDEQVALLRDKVAALYASRAAQRVAEGAMQDAEADIQRAVALNPTDRSLGLQRVLIHVVLGQLDKAQTALDAVPDTTKGHEKVQAILLARRAESLIQNGDIETGQAMLEEAKALGSELPEVHIATARLLATSAPVGVWKKELREIQRSKLVDYPGRKVTRVAEALSELDWARKQMRGLGPSYPYRAADSAARIEELAEQLRSFYPFEVAFQGDPKAVLELKNAGTESIEVAFKGRGGRVAADSAEVGPGSAQTITIERPGLLVLEWGGKSQAMLAEPYTRVTVPVSQG